MSSRCATPRLYRIWAGMKQRCYNPNHPSYRSYGGRGITICDEWKNSFRAFAEWSLENGYADPPNNCKTRKDVLSIDRIDNDKGYSPTNCQWVTLSRNSMKKRPYAEYGKPAVIEFAKWLYEACNQTAKRIYVNDSELHGGWKIRDFISYAIDQQCGISRITVLKEKDVPKARAFAEKVLALLIETRKGTEYE